MPRQDEPKIVWKEPGDHRHRGLVERLLNGQLADFLTENGYRRLGVEVRTTKGRAGWVEAPDAPEATGTTVTIKLTLVGDEEPFDGGPSKGVVVSL